MSNCTKFNSSRDDYAYINKQEEAFFRHKDDMECVAKNPCRVMEKIIKDDKKKGLSLSFSKIFKILTLN